MDILISNMLLESILNFGKWSNVKYTYTLILRWVIYKHYILNVDKWHKSKFPILLFQLALP